MPTLAYDVCIVGLGPTGRGLANRCAAVGLRVVAVDPRPDRPWHPTYASWVDELPSWVPESTISARVERPLVWTDRRHVTTRPYCVLSKERLRAVVHLDGVEVVSDRAVTLGAHEVHTKSAHTISAAVVVDARGLPRVGHRPSATAHGIFVDADRCRDFVAEDEALLLDWRSENGATNAEPPSFLYAVPIGDGTVLFEEINIGLSAGLTQKELRRRTIARLDHHGVRLHGNERTESAHYVLDQGPPGARLFGRQPLPFGSRGGMMHPCTGYSVVNSLAHAEPFVAAIAAGRNPIKEVWTKQARLVYWMRLRGLAGVGRLTYDQSKSLFDAFFDRSPAAQFSLLSAHHDVVGLGSVLVSTVSHTWPFNWRFDLVGWTHRHRWDGWHEVESGLDGEELVDG